MNLNNKIAIVTGSSKGIGLEISKMLLEKGVKVSGWSRSGTAIDHENFQSIKVDVGSLQEVKQAYAHTLERFGEKVSILINNAGLGFEGDIINLKEEDWHLMFRTNVDSIFYCTKLVIPEMREMDEGHIINISSIAGTNGVPGMAGYCATKHAVRGLSQSLFKELRQYGIKVSTVYPGSTKTNFFDDIKSVDVHDNMMMPEDIAKTVIELLETSSNYLPVDIEVRPLRPKGK